MLQIKLTLGSVENLEGMLSVVGLGIRAVDVCSRPRL